MQFQVMVCELFVYVYDMSAVFILQLSPTIQSNCEDCYKAYNAYDRVDTSPVSYFCVSSDSDNYCSNGTSKLLLTG